MQCYQIPGTPLPLLLPLECVADVVARPEVAALEEARTNWMQGHVTWRNQRLPVMSYSALHDPQLDESQKDNQHLVVLNPVPDAVRKAYSGLICFGDVDTVTLDESATYQAAPEAADRRYFEATVSFDGKDYLIPKLTALAVAFSYF